MLGGDFPELVDELVKCGQTLAQWDIAEMLGRSSLSVSNDSNCCHTFAWRLLIPEARDGKKVA